MNLSLPAWVADWLGDILHKSQASGASWIAETSHGRRFRLVSLCIPNAQDLDDEHLSVACRDAYLGLRDIVGDHSLVRVWNGMPDILDEASRLRDRYMVFNAGRYAAFKQWFGGRGPEAFAALMPAATGVGHASPDLIIHALADTHAGTAVENPRQQAAYRYSPRYGPQSPCFSRATRVVGPTDESQAYVLLSGTASIVGEDTVHANDLASQLDETITNLDVLIQAAGGQGVQSMQEMRVYHTNAVSTIELLQLLDASPIGSVPAMELYPVVLCRDNLLVEIEGIATVS